MTYISGCWQRQRHSRACCDRQPTSAGCAACKPQQWLAAALCAASADSGTMLAAAGCLVPGSFTPAVLLSSGARSVALLTSAGAQVPRGACLAASTSLGSRRCVLSAVDAFVLPSTAFKAELHSAMACAQAELLVQQHEHAGSAC